MSPKAFSPLVLTRRILVVWFLRATVRVSSSRGSLLGELSRAVAASDRHSAHVALRAGAARTKKGGHHEQPVVGPVHAALTSSARLEPGDS